MLDLSPETRVVGVVGAAHYGARLMPLSTKADTQRQMLREYAETRGWELAEIIEVGVDGNQFEQNPNVWNWATKIVGTVGAGDVLLFAGWDPLTPKWGDVTQPTEEQSPQAVEDAACARELVETAAQETGFSLLVVTADNVSSDCGS